MRGLLLRCAFTARSEREATVSAPRRRDQTRGDARPAWSADIVSWYEEHAARNNVMTAILASDQEFPARRLVRWGEHREKAAFRVS